MLLVRPTLSFVMTAIAIALTRIRSGAGEVSSTAVLALAVVYVTRQTE
jgi:hypothetical protein